MGCYAFPAVCVAIMTLVGCSNAGGTGVCGTPVPNCVVTNGPASGGFAPCSDVAKSPICENTGWKCPAGTVPMEQCACTYRAGAAQYCGSDASAGDASDAPLDAPPEHVPVDAVELDGPASCGDVTCGSGQICVAEHGGVDASPTTYACYDLPTSCDGQPSCACIQSVSIGCGIRCVQHDGRQFGCGEGAS
jgi:hypothetical protein